MADGIQIDINAAWKGDAAVSQATASLSKLNSVQTAAAKANDAHIAGYANSAKEIAAMNTQFNNQTQAVTKTRSTVDTLMASYRAFVAYSIPIAAAGVAIKKSFDFAKMGAEIEYTRSKFDNLARTIGTTGDAFLYDLRLATKGTVSDFDLLRQGSDLLNLDLAKTKEEAVRLSRVMAGLGMDTGQLTLALANQSTKRLDQLNVSLDRFNQIKREVAAETGLTGQDLYKETFLQAAEYGLERMGSRADSGVAQYDRVTAQLANIKAEVAMSMARTFDKPITWLAGALGSGQEKDLEQKAWDLAYANQQKDFAAGKFQKDTMPWRFGMQAGFDASASADFYKKQLQQQAYQTFMLGEKSRNVPGAAAGEGAVVDYAAAFEGAIKITAQTEKFSQVTAELNEQLALENEKLETMTQKYGENSDKVAAQTQKVQDIKDGIKNVAASATDMGDAMVLSNLAAMGGMEELQIKYALASGEITQKAYDQQMAIMKISQALADNKIGADVAAKAVGKVMSADGFAGKMTMDIYINYIISGGGGPATSNNVTQTMVGDSVIIQGGGGGAQRQERKAEGGPLSAPVTMVGERGYEYVLQTSDGRFVVVPHEASKWMAEAGMMPSQGMASGGVVKSARASRGGFKRGSTLTPGGGGASGAFGGGGIAAADAAEVIMPEIADTVSGSVSEALSSSAQLQALSDSVVELKAVNDTLVAILQKTASAGDIGRAVNGDAARQA